MEIKIRRLFGRIREQAILENASAQAETNKANIDYVAMMSDIEIPTEEEDGTFKEVQ